MWEREPVLRAIAGRLDDARRGIGASYFVIGDAGLGKTSVLDRGRELAGSDFRVALARGDAMESSLPFGLLGQAFDALGDHDVLAPDARAPSSADARAARFYRTLRWLQGAASTPLLFALDDLHWADPDSLALLSFLGRRIAGLSVVVLGTLRPWPPAARELVFGLTRQGLASSARLEPLGRESARALLAERLGRPPPEPVSAAAWSVCGGNPLLLEQVAMAIARGEDVPDHGTEGWSKLSRDLLLARFAGLTTPALRYAQAASVLGTHFRPELAGTLARLEDAESTGALDGIWQSGLVREADNGLLEFVHPLFRQVLYEDLGAPLRGHLHGRAFALLRARGMEREAAEHALRANLVGDRAAVEVLEKAGRAALGTGASAAAIRNLEAAVDFAGADAGPELLLAFGEALLAGGRPARAIAVHQGILQRADLTDEARSRALRRLGRALLFTGSHEAAAERFQEAAAVAQEHDPVAAVRALIGHAIAFTYSAENGMSKALELATRARELARAAGPAVQVQAEVTAAIAELLVGDAGHLETLLEVARALERDPGLVLPESSGRGWGLFYLLGYACITAERLPEAERALTAPLAIAERRNMPEAIASLNVGLADVLARRGRLTEALAAAGAAAALGELVPQTAAIIAAETAFILLQAGRLEESQAMCEKAEAGTGRGWIDTLWLCRVRGERSLREGDHPSACESFELAESITRRMALGEPCFVPWARHAIAAYLRADRVEDASRVIAWLDDCATRLPGCWIPSAAATGHAGLAERAGDHGAAQEAFERALALHEEAGLPLDHVEALLEYGAYLRRRGQTAQARPLLERALELAEACGAAWLAGHVRQELEVAAGRRRRLREPGALTPQERRVAELAAQGRSNQEIARTLALSIRTVGSHLERVYDKLGIHSRHELMRLGIRPRE
jgi:DNA-binding CsgD family transcriptional regulator